MPVKPKVLYLEGIRGIAAFMVFCHHFLLSFYSSHYYFNRDLQHLPNLEVDFGQSVFSAFTNGNFCVCIFFVLSGFVLSRKYFQSGSVHDLVSGAGRRFIRLYIPIAATIIIVYLTAKAGLFYNASAAKFVHSQWCYEGIFNIPDITYMMLQSLFCSALLNGNQVFNTVFWTMPIELYFSFFVYGFLLLTHYTSRRKLVIVLTAILCILSNNVFAVLFLSGISLNYISQPHGERNKFISVITTLILLFVALVLGSYPTNDEIKGTLYEHLGHTLVEFHLWFHALGAYLLVLAFVLSPRLQRLVSMRFFRFLGYISFSLYLLHVPVFCSLGSFVFLKVVGSLGYNYSVLVVFLISTGALFLLSWLMTKYIDEPGTRLARYVYERFFGNTAADDANAVGRDN